VLGRTPPVLVSGTGAAATAGLLTGVGASIAVLDGPAGAAAERKLLRSVFFKGMSAAIVEALRAARAAGQEDWLRGEIAAELESCGAATVRRVVEGSLRHAVRRDAEMTAAAEMLTELGVDPLVATASRDQLAELARTSALSRIQHQYTGGGRCAAEISPEIVEHTMGRRVGVLTAESLSRCPGGAEVVIENLDGPIDQGILSSGRAAPSVRKAHRKLRYADRIWLIVRTLGRP
jgi:uncharacterized protein DUF1932